MRERATLHGIRLSLKVDGKLGTVSADELRLKQVMLNLLSNAVKFTPDGGRVTVRAWRDGDEIDVTVTDTGIGIEPADQDRIFDSFQQGERSASSSEGTGLGLTLSRRIVELHDGRIWLSSTPGEGSTFGFAIPQPASASAPEPDSGHHEVAMSGPTVVVIEDDPRSAELVELHLRAAGLRTVVASSGEQGLDLVRAEDPVAVVLDIHLPGMNGWEVLAALKADRETAHVPVVVVSVEPERGRGFALGATEYLVKPVSGAPPRRREARGRRGGGPGAERAWSSSTTTRWHSSSCAAPSSPSGGRCTRVPEASRRGLVRTVSPSVVVMDLLMPQVDGFAVIDELRPDPRTAAIRRGAHGQVADAAGSLAPRGPDRLRR